MELLEEYVVHASKLSSLKSYLQRLGGEHTLASDYLGPFHDEQYISVWRLDRGMLQRLR